MKHVSKEHAAKNYKDLRRLTGGIFRLRDILQRCGVQYHTLFPSMSAILLSDKWIFRVFCSYQLHDQCAYRRR
jgi:hypothetical protein